MVEVGSGVISSSETEDLDWINNWKKYFSSFTIEDILIKPTWEELKEEDKDKFLIEIDPGISFGTGKHETTQLCIRQLLKYIRGNESYTPAEKHPKVLDVGCGSGILSIVALKLGAREVVGTDLDADCMISTKENMEVNHLDLNLGTFYVGNLIDDEEDEKMNVTSLKDKFDVAFNGMVPTGLLHGKMKPNQKDEVMNSFKNGDTKILISTTVIEVGVDVKNATMMVIFNAERFGLATLHQLRGRVGRNDMQSYCYLISDYDAERLKVLEESNDGFYISEQDFKLRGGGDIFGIRQSGEQSFKIANLNRDYKILMQCKSDAEEFLKSKNLDDYKEQKEILENLTIA